MTWFLIGVAGAGVLLCGKRPGRSPERRACPEPGAGRVAAAAGARATGPASAQPPPRARGGEGRGRRTPATWRKRGGNGPELLAGVGRGVGARLAASGSVLIAPASGCAFAAHFLLSSGPGDALPSEQRRLKRLPLPGPLRTSSFSRAAGPAEAAGPGHRRRLCLRSPALSGRARCGRVARRWAGSAGAAGKGRGAGPTSRRRKDGGELRPPRSPSAWSAASPTPWPWLR